MPFISLQQQLEEAKHIAGAMQEAIHNVSGVYAEWSRRQTDMLDELALKRSILESVPSGVSVSDATRPDMPLLFVNRAFERMTGYSRKETVGKNCRFLQGQGTDPAAVAAIRTSIQQRSDVTLAMKNYRKDGTLFWNELSLSPLFSANGDLTHYVGVQSDISDRMELKQRLEYLAHHDHLTALPNRAVLIDRLASALDAARPCDHEVVVLFLDLDGFKPINDIFGHKAGDTILQAVANRMKTIAPDDSCLARIGGDEFILIAEALPPPQSPEHLRKRLQAHIEQPVLIAEGQMVTPRISIGLAVFPADGNSAQDLLHAADQAMYAEKRAHSGRTTPSLALV